MKLKDWMSENDISPEAVAAGIGKKVRTVYRYMSDERIPDKTDMQKIAELTAGSVKANDFYHANQTNQ